MHTSSLRLQLLALVLSIVASLCTVAGFCLALRPAHPAASAMGAAPG